MVARKIVKIDEKLCNGCGSCIPKCAEGALQLINGKAKVIRDLYCDGLGACLGHCPQGAITIVEREAEAFDQNAVQNHLAPAEAKSGKKTVLPQWPVKINLVPIEGSFYEGADLLIAADCAPVAYPKIHETLQPGKRIFIGCPKFDDASAYAQKLGEILKRNNISSITIAHMEVPCCSGLKWAVDKAIGISGKHVPTKRYVIAIGGGISEF
jgi:NAD-dependent dihydropyrimidine dehydrogenase PreA subunit